jgi:hypothetical protein
MLARLLPCFCWRTIKKPFPRMGTLRTEIETLMSTDGSPERRGDISVLIVSPVTCSAVRITSPTAIRGHFQD